MKNLKKNLLNLQKKIAEKPKSNLIEIKRLINLDKNLQDGIKIERNSFYSFLDSKNKIIGIESFFSKKKPNWED